jgi:hypothetical protein
MCLFFLSYCATVHEYTALPKSSNPRAGILHRRIAYNCSGLYWVTKTTVQDYTELLNYCYVRLSYKAQSFHLTVWD